MPNSDEAVSSKQMSTGAPTTNVNAKSTTTTTTSVNVPSKTTIANTSSSTATSTKTSETVTEQRQQRAASTATAGAIGHHHNSSRFSSNAEHQDSHKADASVDKSSIVCRYFMHGVCRFGLNCHYSHEIPACEAFRIADDVQQATARWHQTPIHSPEQADDIAKATLSDGGGGATPKIDATAQQKDKEKLSSQISIDGALGCEHSAKSLTLPMADTIGVLDLSKTMRNSAQGHPPSSINQLCPYAPPCPFGIFCIFALHLLQCRMCDQYCLQPNDPEQRRKHHLECVKQHEQAMEYSFAMDRSKDKVCGICYDVILSKTSREKRFGILPNCTHIFCLECIRKWRQEKTFEFSIVRSCPECRVPSDYVFPSAFWIESKEEKEKILTEYRATLGSMDCKYFKKGEGSCPFGNKCFYKHALPNGMLVDVGTPSRMSLFKRLRALNEQRHLTVIATATTTTVTTSTPAVTPVTLTSSSLGGTGSNVSSAETTATSTSELANDESYDDWNDTQSNHSGWSRES